MIPGKRILIVFGALILCLALSRNAGAEIKFGAASADITPPVKETKVTLGGYGQRKGKPAKGVHDPVFAKAFVVESEGKKVAVVAIDLVESSNEIRDAVLLRLKGTAFGNDNVFISATHSHSAPGAVEKIIIASVVFGKYSQPVVDHIADGIVKAIKEADSKLTVAKINVAQAKIPGITRNRRVNYYNYDTRRFTKPYDSKTEPITDDTFTVIRVDDLAGRTKAVIVHFATHATVLGGDNMLVSADWPGVMRNEVAKKYPDAEVIYLNGAEGDQEPEMCADKDDFKCLDWVGKRVADAALPLVDQAKPINAEPLMYKIVWRKVNARASLMGIKIPKSLVDHWFKAMPFSAIRIGDLILLGAPVEAISEIGQTVNGAAKGFGYKYPVYVGLMNDHYMYAATPEEIKKGGYEAQNTVYGDVESAIIIGELTALARELAK
jgi:hypothetical protein